MDEIELKNLLTRVKRGSTSIDKALKELETLPFKDLGFAIYDSHRVLRRGFPEVILGAGKTARQIADIAAEIVGQKLTVLVTRLDEAKAETVLEAIPDATYDPVSRCLWKTPKPIKRRGKGTILIISAGTSDIPVAEEAFVTARLMGNRVDKVYDIGVAGIHRLLAQEKKLKSARVVIVIAGMEGALPSVVGGLIARPIIAVPTSIGYGASFSGISALLGMLNSCASGVTVVNIDNGFGAAYAASLINRL